MDKTELPDLATDPDAFLAALASGQPVNFPPFIAEPTYFEAADMIEYVNEDIPTVVRQIDENFAIIVSMENRERIVGFQLYAPKRAFADEPLSPPRSIRTP